MVDDYGDAQLYRRARRQRDRESYQQASDNEQWWQGSDWLVQQQQCPFGIATCVLGTSSDLRKKVVVGAPVDSPALFVWT